jgi:hypothetical protein
MGISIVAHKQQRSCHARATQTAVGAEHDSKDAASMQAHFQAVWKCIVGTPCWQLFWTALDQLEVSWLQIGTASPRAQHRKPAVTGQLRKESQADRAREKRVYRLSTNNNTVHSTGAHRSTGAGRIADHSKEHVKEQWTSLQTQTHIGSLLKVIKDQKVAYAVAEGLRAVRGNRSVHERRSTCSE